MIQNKENISDIFDIFHDGVISDYDLVNDTLSLTVEIPYLTSRVNPKFSNFYVKLQNVESISLK